LNWLSLMIGCCYMILKECVSKVYVEISRSLNFLFNYKSGVAKNLWYYICNAIFTPTPRRNHDFHITLPVAPAASVYFILCRRKTGQTQDYYQCSWFCRRIHDYLCHSWCICRNNRQTTHSIYGSG